MRTSFFIAASIFVSVLFTSGSTFASERQVRQDVLTQLKSNSSENRRIAREFAAVKSLQDFHFAQSNRTPGIETLDRLPALAKNQFINDLMFTDRGLASFNYQVLEDELTYSEAYRLLSLFGVQHTVGLMKGLKVRTEVDASVKRHFGAPQNCCEEGGESGGGDYRDYRCIDRATCQISPSMICTSNC